MVAVSRVLGHIADDHGVVGGAHVVAQGGFEIQFGAGLQTEGPIAGVNAGMVMLDDQVGAVLRKLEELGVAEVPS